MIVATHDGTFHADETTACAILSYLHPDLRIIRSRNSSELEKADLIIDVSGINDDRHYDHHSPLFTLKRDNGISYATAGLIWLKFGQQFLQEVCRRHELTFEEKVLQQAAERLDREIMQMVDLNDNGQLNTWLETEVQPAGEGERRVFDALNEFYQRDPAIPYLVAMQNLPDATVQAQNAAFERTVSILRTLLENAAINALNTEHGILRVLEVYDGGKILLLQERLPWTAAVLSHFDTFKNCFLAVYPDRKRGWRVQALPFSRAERFKNKVTAPAAWRGLDFAELDAACGLRGTIFVHKAGFTGGAEDLPTTLQMAKLWLEQGEYAR